MHLIRQLFNTEEKRRLWDNYISLTILQVLNFLLPLLTLPYLVRTLGVEKYGLVIFAQSFVSFLGLIVDYGFNLSATREISVYRDDKNKLTEIFSSVMIIKISLLFFVFLALILIIFSFDKFSNEWFLYIFSYLIVVGQAIFPVWYFQGREKMRLITIVNVISKVFFTLLIFIVIHHEEDYIYVPIIYGTGFLMGGILSLYLLYKTFKQKFVFPEFDRIIYYFKDSSQYFLSRISVSLYTSSSVFILGIFAGNVAVGYYSIAEKLYMALRYMYQPIVQVLYPYVAKYKNVTLFKKVFTLSVFVNISGITMLYFFDSKIFDFLFTKSIGLQSLHVFHILLLATLVVVPTIFLGYPFLAALGYPKYANLSVIIGSIFHVFGLVILIALGQITIYSVATMVLATELIVFFLRIYWVKKVKIW